jgi:hypothetical protein
MFKNLTTALVLLLVVVVVWVGLTVYFSINDVSVSPNAETYITPIKDRFDTTGFDDMTNRTTENLPVSPDTFNALLEQEN